MFCSFIRDSLNKVFIPDWFLQVLSRTNFLTKLKITVAFFTVFGSLLTCNAEQKEDDNRGLVFYMNYDSNKPFELKRMILEYSKNKWLTHKRDSIVINFPNSSKIPDSIVFHTAFTEPQYINLIWYIKNKEIKSNELYISGNSALFEATLSDNQLKVRPKLNDGNLINQNSLQGFALILQAILEMMLAWVISKAFNLPRQAILMVLAANIAAFPLYLLHLQGMFLTESLVFVTKGTIMTIIGMRKIKIYRIILLLIALTFIGFGFKALFFFLARIL